MNLKHILFTLAAVFLSASTIFATTLAGWNFDSDVLSTANTNSTPNGWCTNVTADVGSGTASGFHSTAAAVYTVPAGNGSTKSLSANNWSVNDFYQFTVSTLGAQSVVVSFDAVSSSTGPRDFNLKYSTDGTTFTTYTPASYTNGNSPSWSASTYYPQYSHTNDLSSVTAINNQTIVYFRLVDADTTSSGGSTVGTAGSSRVDNFQVKATTGTPPSISNILPSSLTTNAGKDASFTVTLSTGDTPLTYFWYKETVSNTNLILTVTTNTTADTLTLPSVLRADAASYQVIVSNASSVSVTSAVVSLTVIDPAINTQPVSQQGLLRGTVQFPMSAGGTALSGYQWYFCSSPSDNTTITGPVSNGTQGSGAVVFGATTSMLMITNLHASDAANFVVIVTGTYGSVTSSVATLTVADTGPLAFWNFNDPSMNIANPAPYQGIGSAASANVVTFLQPVQDASDGADPNTAWGTSTYPAQGTLNKQAGVQFNASTVGAKNVNVSFDLRGTSTADQFLRLQFTTDGSTWTDYPVSFTIQSGWVNIYESYSFSLNGFPGVANNPNFGVRIVAEFDSTANYNNNGDANYVGISSTYNSGGTLSYDLVTISADAITNANTPPTITTIPNQSVADGVGSTINFTVGDAETPAASLNAIATSLTVGVGLSVNNLGGGSRQLALSPGLGNSANVNVPILVTVTDGNGDSTVTWFTLTVTPANAPPVMTGLANTNMLPNKTLVVPFTLTDDHTDPATITPTVFSGNTTLVANDVGHLALGGSGSSRTLTITPVINQLGTAPITVSASDGSLTSYQTNFLIVRPNTNVVLVDNFTYDGSGALVLLSDGFWKTHSGTANQLQVGSGAATIDGVHNSEDVNALLIGQPYMTNSSVVLYASFVINYTTLPDTTGAYFTHFKDNTTYGFLARVWAITNAAAGGYRVGIANSSDTPVQFPQNLVANSNYVIVTRLVLTNSVSTLWVNPSSESSPSVTDTFDITTNRVNIYSIALRESNGSEGILSLTDLKAGLTFDSVFPSLQVQPSGTNVILNWSDPTLGIQSTTNLLNTFADVSGATPPYTNNASTNKTMFFRFKR